MGQLPVAALPARVQGLGLDPMQDFTPLSLSLVCFVLSALVCCMCLFIYMFRVVLVCVLSYLVHSFVLMCRVGVRDLQRLEENLVFLKSCTERTSRVCGQRQRAARSESRKLRLREMCCGSVADNWGQHQWGRCKSNEF